MTRWLVAVAAVLLAGCANDGAPEAAPETVAAEQLDPELEILPTDQIAAPKWQVGDWFGHHIYFGPDDPTGTHVNVVVTDAEEGYHLVVDDDEFARVEAVFDIPIVGDFAVDLDTTAFGGGWEVYDFPMSDGATWTGQVALDLDRVYDLTFTATLADGFRTQYGDRPGFEIVGVDGDGNRVIKTDYVPAIGWYTEFISYNLDTPAEDDEFFRAISMGVGHDWRGSYVEYEGDQLVDHFGFMAPGQPDASYGQGFLVADDASHLMWLQFCFSSTGYSDVRIYQPDYQMIECSNLDIPQGNPLEWGGTGQGDFYTMESPMPGGWQVSRNNAGVVAGGGAQIWQLFEHAGSL